MDPSSELLLERLADVENDAGDAGFGGGFPGMGGMGGMGGQNMQQQLLMQLLSNPQTAKMFQDPSFMAKFQDVQSNPGNIMKYMNDPQFMQVFQALYGGGGAGAPNFGGFNAGAGENKPTGSTSTSGSTNKMDEEYIPKPKAPEPKKEEKKVQSEAEQEKEKGNAAYKNKQFEQAITHYRKAIELEPNTLIYRSNLIAVLTETKDFEKAIEECTQAPKIFSETDFKDRNVKDLAKIYARHARVLELQDKLDEAIDMYNKSLFE